MLLQNAQTQWRVESGQLNNAADEAKKEAYLKLKGFNVVGSMENPPTNPDAVKAAGVKA